MKKITVLGGGMVGSAIAIDLAKDHQVSLADLNPDSLKKPLKDSALDLVKLDVRDQSALHSAIEHSDLVVCAVPGFLGYECLKIIIEAGKDVVDISFFDEDALSLNDLAIEKGVTAVVDCGVAPGMSNMILGNLNSKLSLSFFECRVGGLPIEKKWPFNYKAPFSPIDVIEEYTRPARLVENGIMVEKEALSEIELHAFEGIGELESFNSDGLRTLLKTMSHIPNMKEKTLRYPGHAEYISLLKKIGLFSSEKMSISGAELRPIDLTSQLLFKHWKLDPEEEEFTVMQILAGNETEQITYDLLDRYDPVTKTSSMARTTGYTATAVANLLLRDMISEKGIIPPEMIGANDESFNYVLDHLAQRGVHYVKS